MKLTVATLAAVSMVSSSSYIAHAQNIAAPKAAAKQLVLPPTPADAIVQQRISKSILITDHRILEKVASEVDFGEILGKAGIFFMQDEGTNPNGPLVRTPGTWVSNVFKAVDDQQRENAAILDDKQRVGVAVPEARRMNRIFNNWKPIKPIDTIVDPKELRGGPFRLLAIANLLDLAGTIDDRGESGATRNARSLGEMHLVYGLVDKEFEAKGKGSRLGLGGNSLRGNSSMVFVLHSQAA